MLSAVYPIPKSEVTPPPLLPSDAVSALADDLEELCSAGLIQAFRDPSGCVRYRVTEGIE